MFNNIRITIRQIGNGFLASASVFPGEGYSSHDTPETYFATYGEALSAILATVADPEKLIAENPIKESDF